MPEPVAKSFFRLKTDASDGELFAFGYPVALGRHKILQRVKATSVKDNILPMADITHSESSNPLGFSGGGWITNLTETDENGSNEIIGLSSTTGAPSSPGKFALSGPLFDVCTRNLFEFLMTQCGP